jgi:hypothetical protein
MGANREMNDVDDRLRALDPFAAARYEHADAAAMIERITSGHAPRRRRRLAAVLGPLAVASMAGLATVGLLVTAGSPAAQLQGLSVARALAVHPAVFGLALEPLRLFSFDEGASVVPASLSAPDAAQANSTATGYLAYGDPTTSPYTYLFALGSQLPASAPSLDAFLAAAAAHLGFTGTVRADAPSTWQLGADVDPHRVRIALLGRSSPSGLFEFRYVRGDLARPTSRCANGAEGGAADTDRSTMATTLTGLLRSLGDRFQLGPPTYATAWSHVSHAACAGTVDVTAPVMVGGVATNLAVQVEFDPSGTVLDASLPVFTVGTRAAYPLVSPARAAAALVASSVDGSYRSSAGLPLASRKAHFSVQWSSHLMVVELHTPTVGLDAFATTSGSTWLLPVYAFTGDGFAQRAAGQTTWSGDVLAAAAPLVRVQGSRDNQAAIYDLRGGAASP